MRKRKTFCRWTCQKAAGIATHCPICENLEAACESRLTEYAEARSAVYYRVSTELAAYKNVEMERAKSELEEHRLVCAVQPEGKTISEANILRKSRVCEWQRSEAIRIGASRN
jgi:hypothetical protein